MEVSDKVYLLNSVLIFCLHCLECQVSDEVRSESVCKRVWVIMVMVFWGVKQYGLVDGYKCFGCTCCCLYSEDGDSEFL